MYSTPLNLLHEATEIVMQLWRFF